MFSLWKASIIVLLQQVPFSVRGAYPNSAMQNAFSSTGLAFIAVSPLSALIHSANEVLQLDVIGTGA
jgi:hypothetical protein